MSEVQLLQGDCLDQLKTLDDNSIDSIVTDPPYGLSFMGKAWDHSVPSAEVWAECLRVLKPGGHLLSFAGTRTQHRMAVNIEDVGFEIRDMIAWVYGSGFPKSQNVSKAIDKAAGDEREVVGIVDSRSKFDGRTRSSSAINTNWRKAEFRDDVRDLSKKELTVSTTDEAKQWDGWGTALKPALEPITIARKPLTGTVAANVVEHGTGAINIDGCRIPTDEVIMNHSRSADNAVSKGKYGDSSAQETHQTSAQNLGRFPANLIHDGSDEVLDVFAIHGESKSGVAVNRNRSPGISNEIYGKGWDHSGKDEGYSDKGTPARFFYTAKANKRDRTEGGQVDNNHPTVKPTDLMCYLVRLVTPPNGTVLDPFMGSGSTGKACMTERFNFVGIELDHDYIEIARARIESARPGNTLEEFFE